MRFILLCFVFLQYTVFSQVGVGTAIPHASAMLDVSSTTQGFLPPRMTISQRTTLTNAATPATGLMIYCTDCGPNGELQVYNGSQWTNAAGGAAAAAFVCGTSTVTFTYRGSSVTYETVVGANSKCWLKRNLGATQVATSKTDASSYGDLFQWGRGDDGHQSRNSSTTTSQSSVDQPLHGDFIIASTDWRDPRNDNFWQGSNGINNPCPTGFRIPTEAEWIDEQSSWNTTNSDGAFASPLKLPLAGWRNNISPATVTSAGSYGVYWSSTVSALPNDFYARRIQFYSSASALGDGTRSRGASVRCIKN